MLKLIKQRNGIYTEESVFYINCYKLKYGYSTATEAIKHIEHDNKIEQDQQQFAVYAYALGILS